MTPARWLALLNVALVLLVAGLGVLAGASGDWRLIVQLLAGVAGGAAFYCWPTNRRTGRGASPPAQTRITRTTGGDT